MRIDRIGLTALMAGIVLMTFGTGYAQDAEEEFANLVKDECKDLKTTFKKKPDAEVTAQLDKLLGMYKDERADEKAKQEIVGTVGGVLRARSDEVVVHAVKTLGETDEDAVKYIDAVLGKALKAKPPQVERYEACFAALGKLASPRSVKSLTGYLKDKDYSIIAEAATALKGFKDCPGEVRKEIFEELLKNSEGPYSGSQSNPNSEPARKWNVIKGPMMEALNAVSHQELSDPQTARRWFNEVKKANWDKLE